MSSEWAEFKPHSAFGCSPNGNRTRISALRGLRPKPLDDRAVTIAKVEFSISKCKP